MRSSKHNADTVRPFTRLGSAHELVHRLSRRWPPRSVSDSRPRAGSSATPSPSRPTETRARPAVNPRQGACGDCVRRSPWLHGESLGADRGPPLRGEAAVASCALGAVNGGLGDGADEDGAGRPTGAARPARVGPSAQGTTPPAAPSGPPALRERMLRARAASPRTASARPAPRGPSPPGRTKRSACPRALARPGRCRPRRAALRRRPSVGPARPEATARAAACPRWRAPRIAGRRRQCRDGLHPKDALQSRRNCRERRYGHGRPHLCGLCQRYLQHRNTSPLLRRVDHLRGGELRLDRGDRHERPRLRALRGGRVFLGPQPNELCRLWGLCRRHGADGARYGHDATHLQSVPCGQLLRGQHHAAQP